MKTVVLALIVLPLLSLSACGGSESSNNPTTPDTSSDAAGTMDGQTATPVTREPGQTDRAADNRLALGLLAAIDDHEIQAAQQALAKNVTAPVMDYARLMEKAHTDNLVATKALGALADTDEVQALKSEGAAERAGLAVKSGTEFETAYIDAMVRGHTDALALIDGKLLPLSSDGPVKDHLARSRQHVAMHLEAANNLRTSR